MILRSEGPLPLFTLLVALLWSDASHVLAEAADLAPESGRIAVGGELGYHAAQQTASTLYLGTSELSLRYAFDQRWAAAVDFGLVAASSTPDRGDAETVLRPGNPTALGYLRLDESWSVGAGFAIPLASIGDGSVARLYRAAYNFAAAMKGLSRPWLWSAGRAAGVTTLQWQGQLHPELAAEAELWPTLLWRAVGSEGGNAVDVFIPSALTLWLTRSAFRPGVGLSAAWLLTNEVDRLQLAVEPRLRFQLPRAFVELRYLHNLDEPLAGPRGRGVWGLHLAGGGEL